MILRPRQAQFVDACIAALNECGNTLGIAPTGAGKTVMGSAILAPFVKRGPVLVIQHRDELVKQNKDTFKRYCPSEKTDVYTAERKAWSDGATFAMVQTLCRPSNLATMPGDMTGLFIDECHHVAADTYMRIVDTFRERSPKGVVLGLTATPERGDKQALTSVFNNVADKIGVGELIASGNLVPPKAYRMDIGLNDQLQSVSKTGAEFDMGQVEAIMDKRAVHSEIIRHWKEKAQDRATVVFCSTIEHAQHLAEAFREEGVTAEAVHSEMSDDDNATILRRFDQGRIKVLLNVMKLTEGWDCQRVGCVVLVRPCSQKSTMIQMIGRGLRPCIDAKRYPGVIKSDCIVLDFGASLMTHGDIDAGDRLFVRKSETGEAPAKKCPECGIQVPAATMACPVCGYIFPVKSNSVEAIESFEMSEMQIISLSPFRWESLFNDAVRMANGLTAWAGVIKLGEVFSAIGAPNGGPVTVITRTNSKELALAQADDYLRSNGDRANSRKTKSWIKLPPTDAQLKHMADVPMFGMSRYRASCLLTWRFNESRIKKAILG
jgi:superfamily II DNA or RNA helicase